MNTLIKKEFENKKNIQEILLLNCIFRNLWMINIWDDPNFESPFYFWIFDKNNVEKIEKLKKMKLKYFNIQSISNEKYLYSYLRIDSDENELKYFKWYNLFIKLLNQKRKFSFVKLFCEIFDEETWYMNLFIKMIWKYESFIRKFWELTPEQFWIEEEEILNLFSIFNSNKRNIKKYCLFILLFLFKKDVKLYEWYFQNKLFNKIKRTLKNEYFKKELEWINFDKNYYFRHEYFERYQKLIDYLYEFENSIKQYWYEIKFYEFKNNNFYEYLHNNLKKYDYII